MYLDTSAMIEYVDTSPEATDCVTVYQPDVLALLQWSIDDTTGDVISMTVQQFPRFGNKVYPAGYQQFLAPDIPNAGYACIQDWQHMPSQYDHVTPFYYEMAIVSVLLLFYGAYRLILHPFWRPRT